MMKSFNFMIMKKGRHLLGICNACMKYGMRFHAKTCTLGSMIDGRGEVLALLKSSCAIDQLIFSTSSKKAQSKSLVFVFTNWNMKIYVLIIKS